MRTLHFSFDDVAHTLHDLTRSRYASAFDQPFLRDLRRIHAETGAVFTLFCFNRMSSLPEYDIGRLPAWYRAEFAANADWLRFGFHAEDDGSRYSVTPGIGESYDRCVRALRTLTGSEDCIDPVLRLGFFAGNRESVMTLRRAQPPVLALYAADDDRLSYCLDEARNDIVKAQGRLDDADTGMTYIRTLPRVDRRAADDLIEAMRADPFALTEVFLHEYVYLSDAERYRDTLTRIAAWATQNGLAHGFHSDILRRE